MELFCRKQAQGGAQEPGAFSDRWVTLELELTLQSPWSSPIGLVLWRLKLSFTFLVQADLLSWWAQEEASGQSPFLPWPVCILGPFLTLTPSPSEGMMVLMKV